MMAHIIHAFVNGGIDFSFRNALHFFSGFIDTFQQAPESFVSRSSSRSGFVDIYRDRFIVAKRTTETSLVRPG